MPDATHRMVGPSRVELRVVFCRETIIDTMDTHHGTANGSLSTIVPTQSRIIDGRREKGALHSKIDVSSAPQPQPYKIFASVNQNRNRDFASCMYQVNLILSVTFVDRCKCIQCKLLNSRHPHLHHHPPHLHHQYHPPPQRQRSRTCHPSLSRIRTSRTSAHLYLSAQD